MPPFSGFWGKVLLARATIEAGDWWLAFAVLAVGLLTLYAMARLWAAVFWSAHPEGDAAARGHAPAAMLAPLALTAGLILLVGVWAAPFLDAAGTSAAGLVDPGAYVAAVLGAEAPAGAAAGEGAP
jgi:multicomponent Na+:H+ antiporter subunit D